MERITVERGEVVGIGKIKIFPSNRLPYEIPMLSFLMVQEKDGVFASICIHLQIDGFGATPEEARNRMKAHIIDFLYRNFEKSRSEKAAWEYLEELFMMDDTTKELWDVYRKVQVRLSQKGVKTDITSELIDRINVLQDQINKLQAVKEKVEKKLANESEASMEYQEVA